MYMLRHGVHRETSAQKLSPHKKTELSIGRRTHTGVNVKLQRKRDKHTFTYACKRYVCSLQLYRHAYACIQAPESHSTYYQGQKMIPEKVSSPPGKKLQARARVLGLQGGKGKRNNCRGSFLAKALRRRGMMRIVAARPTKDSFRVKCMSTSDTVEAVDQRLLRTYNVKLDMPIVIARARAQHCVSL